MLTIALITLNSSLVPLIEGLCKRTDVNRLNVFHCLQFRVAKGCAISSFRTLSPWSISIQSLGENKTAELFLSYFVFAPFVTLSLLSWSERGIVNPEVVGSIPAKIPRTEKSNLHVLELHKPSNKGTKLLFLVIKAKCCFVNILRRTCQYDQIIQLSTQEHKPGRVAAEEFDTY